MLKVKNQKIYFIGIGGIGVSALAGLYLTKGHKISGSDLTDSPILQLLKEKGARINIGPPKASDLALDVDLVVYSAAVPQNNPELKKAKRLGIKTRTYAQALGELTKKMFTIAVSGMHGKSTTTAMLALVLEKAGLDPTVIIGTKLREWENRNFRVGKSKYLVIEADEYNASFLNYWPKIIVLLNIEEEHLDYYKDLNHIMRTFEKYVSRLDESGVLVTNEEDASVRKISQKSKVKTQVYNSKVKTEGLRLRVSGTHNLSNAAAVLKTARMLGIPKKKAVSALNEFNGTWRRMEYRGKINSAKIYDDYGHHPTEIKATLQGARHLLSERAGRVESLCKNNFSTGSKHKKGELWVIFQPHQYQRTYKLFDQFADAFGGADRVVLLPIYSVAGREKESLKKKVSSEKLVERIHKLFPARSREIIHINSFQKAKIYLKSNLKRGDICIIMGAGDIYKLTETLFNKG